MPHPNRLEHEVKPDSPGRRRLFSFLAIGIPLFFLFKGGPLVLRYGARGAQTVPLVTVQRWAKPQSGWIYLLDSNDMRDTAQVLLVNPAQGSVEGAIQTGNAPDMALSPSGKRLYVVSGAPGVISVVDTETGSILQQFPAGHRTVQLIAPSVPSMTVSPNGRWLTVMEMTGGSSATATYSVVVFDTLNNNELAGETAVDACGIGRLVWVSDSKAFVHCLSINNVSVLVLNGAGQPSAAPLLPLPEALRPGGQAGAGLPLHVGRVAYVAFLPDGENAVFFTPFGEVSEVNLATQRVSTRIAAKADSWIPFRDWPQSSDGKKIYIGTGVLATRGTEDPGEINVFDTAAGQYTGAIKTSAPFWSLALSKDDRYLYAVSMSTGRVLILDTLTNKEMGVIENVGARPALAIAAP